MFKILHKIRCLYPRNLYSCLLLISGSLITCLLPVPVVVPAILLLFGLIPMLPLGLNGYITRLIVAILLIVSSNAFLGIVFWSFKIPFTPRAIVFVYAFLLLSVLLAFPKQISRLLQNKIFIINIEVVALIIALFAMAIPLKPLIHSSSAITLTRILTFTDDNTSHLSIVKNIDSTHRYLFGNTDLVRTGILQNTAYPQGWHINTSLVEQAFAPSSSPDIRQLLLVYYLVAVGWIGALSYLFVIVTYHMIRSIKERVSSVALLTALIALASFFFISTIYPLFTWGAHPEIASYALFLLLLLLLNEFLKTTGIKRHILMSLILLTGMGISFIYYFQLPIVLAFICLLLLVYYRSDLRVFWKKPQTFAFGGFILASLVPIILYLKYIGQGQSSVVNASGGTMEYANLFILGVSLFALAYAFKHKKGLVRWSGLLLLSSFIFMCGIMLYQYHAIGSIQYYSFKASQTVVLLAFLILVALATEAIYSIFLKSRVIAQPFIALIILVGSSALATTYHSPLFDIYIQNKPYGLDSTLAANVIKASRANYPQDTITIGSCASYFDVRATRMIIALSGKSSPYQSRIANAQYDSTKGTEVFTLIKDYATLSNQKINILSSDPILTASLRQHLGLVQKNVNFINITSSLSQPACPLRLH